MRPGRMVHQHAAGPTRNQVGEKSSDLRHTRAMKRSNKPVMTSFVATGSERVTKKAGLGKVTCLQLKRRGQITGGMPGSLGGLQRESERGHGCVRCAAEVTPLEQFGGGALEVSLQIRYGGRDDLGADILAMKEP